MDVLFRFWKFEIEAKFNDSPAASAIYHSLPFTSSVNRWGDEIYFEIPVKLSLQNGTLDVKIGDIAYWPEGACLCLFFGKTPASIDDRPRPASEVNLVGTFSLSPMLLRKVTPGTSVHVLKSFPTQV